MLLTFRESTQIYSLAGGTELYVFISSLATEVCATNSLA